MKYKRGQKVYCLYVNATTFYISFKIEQGEFLGRLAKQILPDKAYYAVGHTDDDTNYLQIEDIFATEAAAMEGLKKILETKLKLISDENNKK